MNRQIVLENTQAPGDSLMLSCAVRDLHKQYPNEFRTMLATRSPDVWVNNPYNKGVDRAHDSDHIRAGYSTSIHASNQRRAHFASGFGQDMSEKFGMRITLTDLRPDVHLTAAEKDPAACNIKGKYWLVMAGGKQDFTAKHWDGIYWQQLVDDLSKDTQIVQAGGSGHVHKSLSGVVNLVGKTTFREFMVLVYHSQGIVCPVTCGMHLAAAFNKCCVVIAGGREPWWWEAYTRKTWAANIDGPCPSEFVDHAFLHTQDMFQCCARGGCWRSGRGDKRDPANNCRRLVRGLSGVNIPECLHVITPAKVAAAVRLYMAGRAVPIDDIPAYLRPPLSSEPLQPVSRPVYMAPPVPKPRPVRALRRYNKASPRYLLRHVRHMVQPPPVTGNKLPVVPVAARVTGNRLPVTRTVKQRMLPHKPPVVTSRSPAAVTTSLKHIRSLTVNVLLYGDYPKLAQRCLQSIYTTVDPKLFELRLGLNAVSPATSLFVDGWCKKYSNVRVYQSDVNLFKYPMLRRMWWTAPELQTEWLVHFDDDSWVEPGWLAAADAFAGSNAECRMMGRRYFMHLKQGQIDWIKKAPWYKGRPIDLRKGMYVSNFATGGYWFAKCDLLKELDWPSPTAGNDPIKNNGGDVLMGVACHQHGVHVHEQYRGAHISDSQRRGVSQKHPGR